MRYFTCAQADLLAVDTSDVRWLDPDADYSLARQYWLGISGADLAQSTWVKAHEYGYQYAAILKAGQIISMAAVWRFSPTAWEVAAVSTLPAHRCQGHSRKVIAFVTAYILAAGRLATCSTEDNNQAMAATAKSAGFQEIPAAQVWWKFPDLPDF